MLDVLSTQSPGFAEATKTPPGSLRVGVVRGFPVGAPGKLSDEVSASLDRAADLLGSLGHTVAEAKLDMRPQDAAVILGLMFRFVRELMLDVERPQRLERRTRAFARPGALISDRTKERLLQGQGRLAERLGRVFDDHDVLLTPMMSEPAVPAGIMEGRGATATYFWESGWVPFTILWNVTGQPAASVPTGFSSDGLPLAVQIVGRPSHEGMLLSLAAQMEAASPWSDRRPGVAVTPQVSGIAG
jgi:amidase